MPEISQLSRIVTNQEPIVIARKIADNHEIDAALVCAAIEHESKRVL